MQALKLLERVFDFSASYPFDSGFGVLLFFFFFPFNYNQIILLNSFKSCNQVMWLILDFKKSTSLDFSSNFIAESGLLTLVAASS